MNLKILNSTIIFLLAFLISSTNISASEELFNNNWQFAISNANIDNINSIENWENVSIPHTPVIEPKIVNNQWQGNCWYRKTIEYNPDWKNKLVFVRFEGAMNTAEVWINGNKKITHQGGYLPFVIDITEDLIPNGENVLYVKLNNEDNSITGPKPLKELDFNMYGGLYRDVILKVKNPLHITDEQYTNKVAGGGVFVTYPKVDSKSSTVSVKTHINNSGKNNSPITINQSIEKDGRIIAKTSEKLVINAGENQEIVQSMEILNPDLWSPQNPSLYKLITTISQNKTVYDEQSTKIGIRKFEFIENKLYINGKETFLRGVNRHQEYPYIGYAISNNADYRDAYKIKNAGFDYVRFSHYPHSKSFLNACDELGIIAIDAILGWQYYREYQPFKEHVYQTSRDMIRRDRNHPCVLAWEVSLNESWMPEGFIDTLTKIAHEEYPSDDCYTAGWQKYGYDIYLQARQHRIGKSDKIPEKPYIVSEYGDWEYYAMNAGFNQDVWGDLLSDERSSRQELGNGEIKLLQQARNIQEAHNDNFNTPAIADGYWVMFDYNRGYADDLETSGIMSIFRLPKFSYYFYQSQRNVGEQVFNSENKPMVHIASYLTEESSDDIRVFSNCAEVELLLDGKSLGTQQTDKDKFSGNLKNAPFTFKNVGAKTGKLTAIGKIDGKEVTTHEISSPEAALSIVIEADLSGKNWTSGTKDAIFVYAKIVDKNNQLVSGYNGQVKFTVSGNASIVGENSPNTEAGIAATLIMAGDSPDEISIVAESGNLKSEPFKISTIALSSE